MIFRDWLKSKMWFLALLLSCVAASAAAQTLTVMTSGALAAPYKLLAPQYEAESHSRLITIQGASMGTEPTAIPMRLANKESADVVILARTELDGLAQKGLVVEGSQTDLAASRIGMAVRSGSPVPDISTVAAFKTTLLAAKSVAYSSSASGVYIKTEMYKRLGIDAEMAPKSRTIAVEPVGEVVARGEVEIGFQQLSELKPIAGITMVGPIPSEVQKVTVFAAGVVASSQHKADAEKLIRFLASPRACGTLVQAALQPTACSPKN